MTKDSKSIFQEQMVLVPQNPSGGQKLANPPYQKTNALQHGQLMQRLIEATWRGLSTGALSPISTTFSTVKEAGIFFQIRVLEQLQHKDAAKAIQIANKETKRPPFDPFLPYEKDLFVADITHSHVAVLNKFNVLPHHMLLITREFVHQKTALDLEDMTAIAKCLQELPMLAFYNGGEEAGASQPHKHLQLLPLPLTEGPEPTPICSLIRQLPDIDKCQMLNAFPFSHAICKLPFASGSWDTESTSEKLFRTYLALTTQLNIPTPEEEAFIPYNFLATREWMMVIPRKQEFCGPISVNSLGFVGGLLARNQKDKQMIEKWGPLRILTEVGHPPNHSNVSRPTNGAQKKE